MIHTLVSLGGFCVWTLSNKSILYSRRVKKVFLKILKSLHGEYEKSSWRFEKLIVNTFSTLHE